jgi:imidazolonepropionase
LLPTAFLHLNETKLPPLQALRNYRVPIAVASDCNPGSSPSASLLLAASLATRLFRLRPAEALAGITRYAASACAATARGTLSAGAVADFAIWNVPSTDELQYWLGRNSCVGVVRSGVQVRGSAP